MWIDYNNPRYIGRTWHELAFCPGFIPTSSLAFLNRRRIYHNPGQNKVLADEEWKNVACSVNVSAFFYKQAISSNNYLNNLMSIDSTECLIKKTNKLSLRTQNTFVQKNRMWEVIYVSHQITHNTLLSATKVAIYTWNLSCAYEHFALVDLMTDYMVALTENVSRLIARFITNQKTVLRSYLHYFVTDHLHKK